MKVYFNLLKSSILCVSIIALCVVNTYHAFGQSSQVSAINFPNVIPPSPDAQGFMRYGEYPVDYCTGLPQIKIPLYEIKSGKLTLPITLDYHAGGIRVDEIPGVAGLGWTLNAGGLFTRTIIGFPDESNQGILNNGIFTSDDISYAPGNGNTYTKMESLSKGQIDCQSDNYYYSTGTGLSNQLVYDTSLHLTPLNYTNDQVTQYASTNKYGPTYDYKVTSDDGTQYTFDQQELTLFDNANWYPTSWWLSSIVSADKADTISFQYRQSPNTFTSVTETQSWIYGINSANTGSTGWQFNTTKTPSYQMLLTQINFRNGYIQFAYDSDRVDMRTYRLVGVSVYNSSNTLIKKYQLAQSNFYSNYNEDQFNYRLRLDSLSLYDGTGAYINKYAFAYYQDNILPPYLTFTAPAGYPEYYAQDYWGFYNGNITNPNLIPYLPAPATAANRAPNASYAQSCSLKSIYFPTGGFTTYNYESNVDFQGNTSGGLRVHSIVSQSDGSTVAVTKHYVYTNNVLDYNTPDSVNYSYIQESTYDNTSTCASWTVATTVYIANPIIPLFTHNGSPALYQIVDEYTDGPSGSFKTEYTYQQTPDMIYDVESPRYQFQYFADMSWQRGQLAGTLYYKLVNGTYKLVKSVETAFSPFYPKNIVSGTLVQQQTTNPGSDGCFQDLYPGGSMGDLFYYFDVQVGVGTMKPIGQYVNMYDDNNDTLSDQTQYTYGSSYHLFPTLVTHIDSKRDTMYTQLKYPTDFLSTAVYDSLYTRNTLSPVIQKLDYKGNFFLSSTTSNYRNWGNHILLPQTVVTQQLSNPADTRLYNHAYDSKGNILSVSKQTGKYISYLWDYSMAYPIAECISPDSAVFAYTSFEANGTGNWIIPDTTRIRTYAMTGTACYGLNSGDTIKASGLNSATTYIVSYWSRAGSMMVNGNPGTLVNTVTAGGYTWNYYEHTIKGATGVSVAGAAAIDELRLFPKGALMTTYTYIPLIGMTSQCTPTNYITYYNYDGLGRLKVVKDLRGNIIKTYQYNYQK